MKEEPGVSSIHPPSAAVIGIGDELLLGQTVDTNGSWLARELSDLGFQVRRRWVIGDRREEIERSVSEALDTVEIVLVTGGLGPTPDDLTKDAVAEMLGLSQEVDPVLLQRLRERFRRRGFQALPAGSEAMARVPAGAEVLPNPVGAAPGLVLCGPSGGCCVLLPGVPTEMMALFETEVVPFLRQRFSSRLQPAVHRMIHTFGIPESVLAERISEVLPDDLEGVSLAYLPDAGGVRLRLTVRGEAGSLEDSLPLRRVEETLESVVAPYRYRSETGLLAEAVGTALLSKGGTVAAAESCTGGLIGKMLTDIPGSSAYFLGGVVAYANQVKVEMLGVSESSLAREGAVSRTVAEEMAQGVATRLGASFGVGVTGVAGPGGGTDAKPPGTVCYAVFDGSRAISRTEVFPGDRASVRERSARATLFLLLRVLRGEEG